MNKKELKEIMLKNIQEDISYIFEIKNMTSFIKVFNNFYFYDYKNLLLIWKQARNATTIIGKEAAINLNLKISKEFPKIALLYPMFYIQNQDQKEYTYSSEYEAIVAFEVSSIYSPDKSNDANIMARIKQITGCTINEATSNQISGMDSGMYNPDKNEILVRKNLSDTMLNKTLISVYIDMSIGEVRDEFNILKKSFIKHIVYSYFDVLTSEDSINTECSICMQKSFEEKSDLIMEICKGASDIIMDLTDHVLSFNQTAIANNLLTSDYYQIVSKNLSEVAKHLDDSYLSSEIGEFAELLCLTDDTYLKNLFDLVSSKKLFSYPPYPIKFKNITKENSHE